MLIRKLVIVLIVVIAGATAFAAPALPCQSISDYRSLLEHVAKGSAADDADFQELLTEVPGECKFDSGGQHFQVSTEQLKTELSAIVAAEDDDRASKVASLQKDLARRSKALQEYPLPVDPTAGPKLTQILARKEFQRVGAQDTRALVREQMLKLMIKLFSLLAKNQEEAALFAEVFTWVVIGVVAIYILWKLYRWATADKTIRARREFIPFAPSAKDWQQWMKEARAAFANGELREAVHASYWAAISHLESSGAWRPDKARTPREYLRLIPAANPDRPLLTEISRTFELVWYGERVPGEEECQAFLARVEQIACR